MCMRVRVYVLYTPSVVFVFVSKYKICDTRDVSEIT